MTTSTDPQLNHTSINRENWQFAAYRKIENMPYPQGPSLLEARLCHSFEPSQMPSHDSEDISLKEYFTFYLTCIPVQEEIYSPFQQGKMSLPHLVERDFDSLDEALLFMNQRYQNSWEFFNPQLKKSSCSAH
jgi:hypothetical protein